MVNKLIRLIARGLTFIWLPVVLLVVWWEVPRPGSHYVPPLWAILDTFRSYWFGTDGRVDIPPSLEQLATGYILALVIGIALGLLLSQVRILYQLTLPLVTFFRGLPSPALIPPLLLIFGLGIGFKISIIALGSVWAVLLNAYDGFRSVDQVQLDTSKSFGFSRWQHITKVLLPSASPQIVAGARAALQISVILMVASEFLASTSGIGYVLVVAQDNFDSPGIWACVLLIGLIGIVLNIVFVLVANRILHWYLGMRALEKAS
jgi:ABC-type nitrate/sulfonate/bicarbonate transport system permease component